MSLDSRCINARRQGVMGGLGKKACQEKEGGSLGKIKWLLISWVWCQQNCGELVLDGEESRKSHARETSSWTSEMGEKGDYWGSAGHQVGKKLCGERAYFERPLSLLEQSCVEKVKVKWVEKEEGTSRRVREKVSRNAIGTTRGGGQDLLGRWVRYWRQGGVNREKCTKTKGRGKQ